MDQHTHKSPEQVLQTLLKKDYFTEWLGLKVDAVGSGYCKLHYTVKKEMLNGFGSIHGGILFAAADSAFAFACNSHGTIAVALEVSISYTRPAILGDELIVEAKEIYLGNKTGLYDIQTSNSKGELVAFFKGTSYRTHKPVE
jgi:acyl-CoA thioesterase